MKYENYTIKREDERNWVVLREDLVIAERDIKHPATGDIVHKKGDEYRRTTHKGFYRDVGKALEAVVADKAGSGCDTIADLSKQLKEIKSSLGSLVSIS